MLEDGFPEFTAALEEMDGLCLTKRTIDEKTYQFICFALAIRSRSAPGVKKHFHDALMAGATVKEMSYILALTMQQTAEADGDWTHAVLGDWTELLKKDYVCTCHLKEH